MLFNQGEQVHGVYFIASGQILYKRKLEVPAYEQKNIIKSASTEGIWVSNQSLVRSELLQRRTETRPIAEFSQGEIIGWEEILCETVVN